MRLALPTAEVLYYLKQLPQPIIEIGAGDGMWLRIMQYDGIDCRGYDTSPRHPSVLEGDHTVAAQEGPTMLAVWPPNGAINDWMRAAKWGDMVIVGEPARLMLDPPAQYFLDRERLPVGRGIKGQSLAHFYTKSI